MEVLLIRHAESVGNAENRIQGWSDSPLSERGRRQAIALARRLAKEFNINALYTSTLRRAWETAEIIHATLGVPLHADDRLKEYDCGIVTGLTDEEVTVLYPELHRRWQEDPWKAPIPGAEDITEFATRVWAAMTDITARHNDSEVPAVIAHGGTIGIYLAQLIGLNPDLRQPWWFDNASLSIVRLGGIRPRIIRLNDICHLVES
ncbi:MAG: histidine phosphatase family protein [Chloroflexi bacterium]|nr:histidine phosphatase family protein [Chloroflexota bacterium]